MSESPYTFAEARAAAHDASVRQIQAEKERVRAHQQYAEAERSYRMALSERIMGLHADGVAWSAAADIARGEQKVAHLKMLRDIAAGVRDAAEQAGFRLNADRRILERLTEWSMRRELAEGGAA